MKVLIADDEAVCRCILESTLAEGGFECLRPARAGRLWPTATAVGKRQLLTLQPASAGDRNLTTHRQRVARTYSGGPRLFLDSSWTSCRPHKRRSDALPGCRPGRGSILCQHPFPMAYAMGHIRSPLRGL